MRRTVTTLVVAAVLLAGLAGVASGQSSDVCVSVGTYDSDNDGHPTTLLLEQLDGDFADIAETTDDSNPDGCLSESIEHYFIYKAPSGDYKLHVRNDQSDVYERWGVFERTVGSENETFIVNRRAPYQTSISFDSPRDSRRFEPGETAQFEARVYNAHDSVSRDVTTEVYVYQTGATRPDTPTKRLGTVSVGPERHETVTGTVEMPDTEADYVVDVEFVTDFGFGEFTSDYVDLGTATVDAFEPPSIDDSTPGEGTVNVGPEERYGFSVDVSDPDSDPTVQWYVDGSRVTTGPGYEFDAADYGAGEHSITVVASDDTDATSDDRLGWTVDVAEAPEITSVSPGNTEVVLGRTVSFSAETESTGHQYDWTIGGQSFTGSSVERTFSSTGEKGVTVAVTNDRGVTTEQSFVVSVERAPPSVTDLSVSASSVTVGESVTFRASADDPAGRETGFDYEWRIGDQTFEGASVETTFTDAATYDVELTVTNDYGTTTTETRTVTVERTPPSVSEMAVTPSSVYLGEEVSLAADASDPAGREVDLDYEWTVGNQTFSGRTVETTVTQPGTHDVVLTVTNEYGASVNRTRSLTVERARPSITSLAVSPSTLTAGETVSLSATAADPAERGTGFSYRWSIGDERFEGATAETRLTTVGTHDVTLTVENEYGSTTTRTRSLTVANDEPQVERVSPEDIADPQSGTEQRFVVAVADADAEPATVTWSVDGRQIAETDVTADERRLSFAHAFETPGDHTVEVTIEDGHGAQSTAEWRVAVRNRPPRIESVAPDSSAFSRMSGTSERFNVSATDPEGAVVSYRWLVDGREQGTGPQYTHTFERPGTRNVTVVARDADGGTVTHTWSPTVQNFRSTPDIESNTATTTLEPGNETKFIGLSFRNPEVNNRTAHVELALSPPSGVTVSATKEVGEGAQAEFVSEATVSPGEQTSMAIAITVEDESLAGQQIDVPYEVIYYPDGQRDSYRVVENATTTIRVLGGETATSGAGSDGADQQGVGGDQPTSGAGPGFTAGSLAVAVCLWLVRRR